MEDENWTSAKQKNAGEDEKRIAQTMGDDDFNPTLADGSEIKTKSSKNCKFTYKRLSKINQISKRKTRLCIKF